jgi:alpha-L-rhamnosidase
MAQEHPPVVTGDLIRPVSVTEPQPGVFVFDMGFNMAGWAQLRTTAVRDQKITLQFNERLNADGTLNTKNLTSHTFGRFQTEEFISAGSAGDVYEPRFTYHGFQYVQVTGLTKKPTLDTIAGRPVHTEMLSTGEFDSSDDRLDRIQRAILQSHLNYCLNLGGSKPSPLGDGFSERAEDNLG